VQEAAKATIQSKTFPSNVRIAALTTKSLTLKNPALPTQLTKGARQ